MVKFWVRKIKKQKNKKNFFIICFSYPSSTPSFQSTMVNATNIPYNLAHYNSSEIPSSFIFQDMSNYQRQKEFNGEL